MLGVVVAGFWVGLFAAVRWVVATGGLVPGLFVVGFQAVGRCARGVRVAGCAVRVRCAVLFGTGVVWG